MANVELSRKGLFFVISALNEFDKQLAAEDDDIGGAQDDRMMVKHLLDLFNKHFEEQKEIDFGKAD